MICPCPREAEPSIRHPCWEISTVNPSHCVLVSWGAIRSTTAIRMGWRFDLRTPVWGLAIMFCRLPLTNIIVNSALTHTDINPQNHAGGIEFVGDEGWAGWRRPSPVLRWELPRDVARPKS